MLKFIVLSEYIWPFTEPFNLFGFLFVIPGSKKNRESRVWQLNLLLSIHLFLVSQSKKNAYICTFFRDGF